MTIIDSGNVITGGTVMPGTKRRVLMFNTFATGAGSDAKVGGGYFTPANQQLVAACDTQNIYERTAANTYARIDTL